MSFAVPYAGPRAGLHPGVDRRPRRRRRQSDPVIAAKVLTTGICTALIVLVVENAETLERRGGHRAPAAVPTAIAPPAAAPARAPATALVLPRPPVALPSPPPPPVALPPVARPYGGQLDAPDPGEGTDLHGWLGVGLLGLGLVNGIVFGTAATVDNLLAPSADETRRRLCARDHPGRVPGRRRPRAPWTAVRRRS